jgi:hypothetical protein
VRQNLASSQPDVAEGLHTQLVGFFEAHEAHGSVLAPSAPTAGVDRSDPYDLL